MEAINNQKSKDDAGPDGQGGDEDAEAEEEEPDLIFKVKIFGPQPDGVKISKKNVCFVKISKHD